MGKKKHKQKGGAQSQAPQGEKKKKVEEPGDKPLESTRDKQFFKQVMSFYEAENYDKAIKNADRILQNHPEHGETLALKGLCLYMSGDKAAGREMVLRGLARHRMSSRCWYINGLVLKSDGRWEDAARSLSIAMRRDSSDENVAHELSVMQLMCGCFDAYSDARLHLLNLAMKNLHRRHGIDRVWLSTAMGYHLTGRHKAALRTLDQYLATVVTPEKRTEKTFESMELEMFRIELLYAAGNLDAALAHINKVGPDVRDQQRLAEIKGNLFVIQRKRKVAADVYRELLKTNEDNHIFHMGLREALGLNPASDDSVLGGDDDEKKEDNTTAKMVASGVFNREYVFPRTSTGLTGYTDEQRAQLKELYQTDLARSFPRSHAVRRMPLDFLTGDDFRQAADAFFRRQIKKGVPSLYRETRVLFSDAEKRAIVLELFAGYAEEFQAKSADVDPSNRLWTLFFLAEHADAEGDRTRALELVEEAIEHTPTTMDLYVLKARVLKHAGDHAAAFEAMDYARSLDLADRWLNVKCVRYAFRNDDVSKADELVRLFLNEERPNALYDMQVLWYEVAAGHAYERLGDRTMALKMFTRVQEHMDAIAREQIDFHQYTFRKQTVRTYIRTVRWMRGLRKDRFYIKAAKGAIRTLLSLAADPLPSLTAEEEVSLAEAKQAVQKKRRSQGGVVRRKTGDDDEDPRGLLLARSEDPLGEALTWAHDLEKYAPEDDAEALVLVARVHEHRGHVVSAFKVLKKGLDALPKAPELHAAMVQLCASVDAGRLSVSDGDATMFATLRKSKRVLDGHLEAHDGLLAHTRQCLLADGAPYASRVLGARTLHALGVAADEVVAILCNLDGAEPDDWKVCESAMVFAQDEIKDQAGASRIKQAGATRFPLCAEFQDKDKRKKEATEENDEKKEEEQQVHEE